MTRFGSWVAAGMAGAALLAGVSAASGAGTLAYDVKISSGNDALDTQLTAVSRLVLTRDKPPPGLAGLNERAQSDKTAFESVLRSQGYFDGTIEIGLDEDKSPIPVTVTVTPGPRTLLGDCAIVYSAPAPAKAPQACKDLGLKPGGAARAEPIIVATTRLLTLLQEQGRPDAKLTERVAIVDHATNRMSLAFNVDPGRAIRFGAVSVKDASGVDHAYLARLATWKPDETYDVRKLEAYRKRLSDLDLFDRLLVKPDTNAADASGTSPIIVDAHERLPHSVGGGVTYATDTGPGLKAFWEHRNLWGEAEHFRIDLQLATITQSLEAVLTLPHEPNTGQSLGFDIKTERDITDAYDKRGASALAQVSTPLGGKWTGRGGISLEAADIRQAGSSDFSVLASLPVGVTFDSTKSLLDPIRGERLSVQAQPAFGTSGGKRAFLILSSDASAYRPLDSSNKLVAAARLRLGTILFSPEGGVPADMRFYSGGGGSVRGFAYQHVGPRDAANNPIGGRAVGEGSLELRYRAWKDIGVVGFVDAGTVSVSPYFADAQSPRIGAGLGLRYYTGFGPLRLDVGTPLNPHRGDSPVQIYISLGQAF